MNKRFLSVGKQFNDTIEKQIKISNAIKTLQWFDLPVKKLPFSQGFALREMIKQMGHKTDKIGYGIYDNSLAFLAMRNNYKCGDVLRATLYAIDNGAAVINVAVDEETSEDILKEQATVKL